MNLTVRKKLLVIPLLFLPDQLYAQEVVLDQNESLSDSRNGWIPYIFATDSLGTAVGAATFSGGGVQPQTSTFGTAFITSNDSFLLSGAFNNYRPGNEGRVLIDTYILANHFTDQRYYAGLTLPGQAPPGTNDSDSENYSTGISNEVTLNINFKYRLPIGSLKDDPIAIYRVKHGLLDSGPPGGNKWNPPTNGQTTVGAKFFYTYRDLNDFEENQSGIEVNDKTLEARTNGINLWLEHNNTDFPRNPVRGSRQVFNLYRDFGLLDSTNSWTNLQASFSKYFDLGKSNWFNQKVVALNFWTSDTISWERSPDGSVNHRPPPGYGSELGGFDHLRSYLDGRFHDKSAVNYTAEMRFIPKLQPLHDMPLLNYFQIDWWQVVPFIEAGRVAPDYNTDLYFKDLKWNVGVGLRLMTFRAVARLDIAVGEEGGTVWAMISQPFARTGI